ncbi:carbohydrate kinase [Tistrella bauzanensis]|uniref:Carbohydrate kinase n=1 Tax=Tistrella bauzanensis TaxID=657419 RepID=A0ABQ1J6A0_9PROT|nr:PfkB family carbohydrate kinase [Tistrella bauzanensis]GGB60992.1 carbohydrate kinase [Tistrella bauzanensis]
MAPPAQARIAMVASLNADRVIRLDRRIVSGGRPRGTDEGPRIGGSGVNVGTALILAGHPVQLITRVAHDALADRLVAEVEAISFDVSKLDRSLDRSPETMLLLDPEGERTILKIGHHLAWVPPEDVLDGADFLFLNSRNPDAGRILAAAAARGMPRIAQIPPAEHEAGLPAGSWPAEVFVASIDDLAPAAAADPWAAASRLAGPGLRWVIVTYGADGSDAIGPDGRRHHCAAPHVAHVVDTTGAGDAFAGGFTDAWLHGADIDTALGRGSAFGALAVQTEGSVLKSLPA